MRSIAFYTLLFISNSEYQHTSSYSGTKSPRLSSNRPRIPFLDSINTSPPPVIPPTLSNIPSSDIPLRAHPPLRLAPIRRAAETRPGPTEVAAGAAQSRRALGVDDRSAGVAGVGGFRWGGGERGCGHVVAFAVAGLAAGAAVEGLVLELWAGGGG